MKRELNRLKGKFERFARFMFSEDPLAFFEQTLGFKPTKYQIQLTKLFTENQFVAARWCRQSGKSHIISALLLHYALIHPNAYIAVVGPSWRQTKLIIRRINSFLRKLPKGSYHKPQKTIVHLSNNSIIEAFPNNPETIRGPSLHVVYCVPGYVNVTLSDGTQIPISEVKLGQQVLTYNKSNGKVEAKKVLRVFYNPVAGRKFVRVIHDFGWFDCTLEHKVFTLKRGYIPAVHLTLRDEILYHADIIKYKVGTKNKASLQGETNTASRAVHSRRTFRRLMHGETRRREEKRSPCYKSLLKTSRIRSIQIFAYEKLRENPTTFNQKSRLGQRTHKVLHSIASSVYRNLPLMLPKWTENHFLRMVIKNQLSVCVSSLVYGRWFPFKSSYGVQHSRFHGGGATNPSTMAARPLGNKIHNKTRQQRKRVLFDTSCKRARQILRLNQTLRYSEHAIQDSSKIEASSLRDMWQTSSAEKSSYLSKEKGCLFGSKMQKVTGKIKSRLETKKIEGMPNLRENFHAHTRQNEDMLIYLQKNLEASAKKTSEIKKQEAVAPSEMFTMWSYVRPYKRPPKNLQCGMSQRTTQNEKQEASNSENLCILRQRLCSDTCKSEILRYKMPRTSSLRTEKIEEIFNLKVEDNHNFFANSILVSNCDEMNFIQNDEEMYDAILFTLSATNGKFICSSTPWSTNSIFYKIFNREDYADFKRSHVTWRDAAEPEGPLKKATLKKIKRQFQGNPWRWKREMEAQWAEDESVWLPQALITSCIDQALYYIDFNERAKGEFFMGVDLGKHRDYSVISVVMREKNTLKLVHLKRFPLKTAYASVIGYVKTLGDRWSSIQKVSVDMTGVGDYIVEDMQNAGIHGVKGINFTQPMKEQLATNLKQRMIEGTFKIPYDSNLIAELNVERFELRKTGGISFSHPEGTHDDRFWSVALALHSSRTEAPSQLARAY